jgi:hypothetical protein
LYNEELHNLYPFPNIIRHIKSRRVGHVARMGKEIKVYKVGKWESPKERDHSEDRGEGGKGMSE